MQTAKRTENRGRRAAENHAPEGYVPLRKYAEMKGLSTGHVTQALHNARIPYLKVRGLYFVKPDDEIRPGPRQCRS